LPCVIPPTWRGGIIPDPTKRRTLLKSRLIATLSSGFALRLPVTVPHFITKLLDVIATERLTTAVLDD
jgi:hypothetical protein